MLKVAPGAALDANFNTLRLGVGSGRGLLDLRGATLTGGVLKANTLELGKGSVASLLESGHIFIDDDTELDAIAVRYLKMGSRGNARIGDPANGGKLPAGIGLNIGTESARGTIEMGVSAHGFTDAVIAATSGGDMTAYLTDAKIGQALHTSGANIIFDAGAMDSVIIDCTGTISIPSLSGTAAPYVVEMTLPPGAATAANVQLGVPENANSSALLELNGTSLTAGTVNVGVRGTLSTNVGSASCGLDLAADAVLSVDGLMEIAFLELPPESQTLYGLKWEGNKVTELEALKAAGKLAYDISALLPPPDDGEENGEPETASTNGITVFIDFDGTHTYVMLEVEMPDYSTYAFSYDLPLPVYSDVETGMTLTFATVETGALPYGNVRFTFDAVGPEEATVGVSVTDSSNETYTFSDSGSWGAAGGYVLLTDDTMVFDVALNFSDEGEYTITSRCYEIDTGVTVESDSIVVNVELEPLYGDANSDGAVDLLDLVFVRNRLFESVGQGDNQQSGCSTLVEYLAATSHRTVSLSSVMYREPGAGSALLPLRAAVGAGQ